MTKERGEKRLINQSCHMLPESPVALSFFLKYRDLWEQGGGAENSIFVSLSD